MKVTQTDEVFQDTLTGAYYTIPGQCHQIAVLGDGEKAIARGRLLAPYTHWEHPALAESLSHEELSWPEQRARFGFVPDALGQSIVVPDDVFAKRFKRIGVLSREVDLDALVAHYEEENCDFSNRPALIRATIRRLSQDPEGLSAAELYVLLKDYQANTPK